MFSILFLAQGVQGSGANVSHTKEPCPSNVSDEDLCARWTLGSLAFLVLCIPVKKDEEDPRRNTAMPAGSIWERSIIVYVLFREDF